MAHNTTIKLKLAGAIRSVPAGCLAAISDDQGSADWLFDAQKVLDGDIDGYLHASLASKIIGKDRGRRPDITAKLGESGLPVAAGLWLE